MVFDCLQTLQVTLMRVNALSCFWTQTGVSISELIAALHGAMLDQLNTLKEKIRPLVARYHGQECLLEWMWLQIDEAVYQNKEVTPYLEFIKQLVRQGRLELGAGREHTKAYLKAYNEGNPCPPLQYYQKVAKKTMWSCSNQMTFRSSRKLSSEFSC